MRLNGKVVYLPQLRQEAIAAGYNLLDLEITGGDELVTIDSAGHTDPNLPPGIATVVANHVPPAPPAQPNYSGDGTARDQLPDAVTNLRAYLGVATPTLGQTAAALKLLIRVVLFIARSTIQ